ncbi:MAG: hydantoinase/oxoprolinase family protein [Candidatus Parvarchaeota archaeon]
MMSGKYYIGIDIGGTFTDIVIFDSETKNVQILKLPSTPESPEEAVINALRSISIDLDKIVLITHATTIATNALLTKTGLPRTGLITNKGLRDIIEIARQRRSEIYNLRFSRPEPLVKRKYRYTISGRMSYDGKEIEPLKLDELNALMKRIKKDRIESLAICLLNSYVNPLHEIQVKKHFQKFMDYVFASSDVDPEFREYERTSTTVVNAALAPLISNYLKNLHRIFRESGINAPFYVMGSNGGLNTSEYASTKPISVIESGPAAGVMASSFVSQILGLNRVITFDMGGTTAKAGIIIDGKPDISTEFEAAGKTHSGRSIKGSGYSVRFPFIDLAEVSAGGGTIAWVDEGGSIRVGPKSAGASPGPAAYGKGGKEATITDANLLLGRLNPDYLLGGKMKIFKELSEKAIKDNIASKLGIDTISAADGIIKLINNAMAKAISIVSIERGRDPRDFVMMAFGGAGPVHSCDLADEIGIKEIFIPPNPGLFSAYGLLTVDVIRPFSKSGIGLMINEIKEKLDALEKDAKESLRKEGFLNVEAERYLDMHYVGQSYEITIPFSGDIDPFELFKNEHSKLYGYSSDDPIEIVNMRVIGKAEIPKIEMKEYKGNGPVREVSRRKVYFNGEFIETPVYIREGIPPGAEGKGPTIIESYDSTIVINPKWSWRVDKYLNINLRRD